MALIISNLIITHYVTMILTASSSTYNMRLVQIYLITMNPTCHSWQTQNGEVVWNETKHSTTQHNTSQSMPNTMYEHRLSEIIAFGYIHIISIVSQCMEIGRRRRCCFCFSKKTSFHPHISLQYFLPFSLIFTVSLVTCIAMKSWYLFCDFSKGKVLLFIFEI